MSKYVCDYDKINDIVVKLNELTNNFTNAVSKFQDNVENNVTGWTGEAKENFVVSIGKKSQQLSNEIKMLNDLSDFIKQASQTIESTDSSLSGMDI